MARRKQDLAGKLSTSSEARPGWRDTITGGTPAAMGQPAVRQPDFMATEPEPEPANKIVRKTYLLYASMIQEIEDLAAQERVGINELVRYLLGVALDQTYNGGLEIPTRPGRRQIDQ
ncbi:MAG: hypothetical protein H6667_11125 [Ardenticatenaceae bacterium]|nr:hypothetical protein [Ardenticatenaceae bacterium]MCB9444344.1 hypothetical protein [Ardenticatenaceae bacterium]